jgi:hypothetical protein
MPNVSILFIIDPDAWFHRFRVLWPWAFSPSSAQKAQFAEKRAASRFNGNLRIASVLGCAPNNRARFRGEPQFMTYSRPVTSVGRFFISKPQSQGGSSSAAPLKSNHGPPFPFPVYVPIRPSRATPAFIPQPCHLPFATDAARCVLAALLPLGRHFRRCGLSDLQAKSWLFV